MGPLWGRFGQLAELSTFQKAERDRFKVSLRDLEMGVDDLERNERSVHSFSSFSFARKETWSERPFCCRMVSSSLQDMEARYNRAIEDKTLLEQELIDKQELEEEMQRLKDEMRGECFFCSC